MSKQIKCKKSVPVGMRNVFDALLYPQHSCIISFNVNDNKT